MRILFTVAFLDAYHGSVLHVREVAEYLASAKGGNHDVTVGSIFTTPEIEHMLKSRGLNVFLLGSIDVSIRYDIVFAYHFPTIEFLLKRGLQCKKMVLGTLSGYEYLETLPNFHKNSSMIIAMSEEARSNHCELYGFEEGCIGILENCIPDKFADFKFTRELSEDVPKRIAVVSNHVPAELWKMKEYLPVNTVVTYFGNGTESYQEITPKVLSDYDVVVTIGKTVQYAMGLGIPVFEYDHFGGNGYITPSNMESEALTNFSGRSTMRKLSAEKLAKELVEDYPKAKSDSNILRQLAIDKFLLSIRVDELMNRILEAPNFSYDFTNVTYNENLDFAHGEAFCNWTGALKSDNFILKQSIECYKKEIETLNDIIKKLNENIEAIQNTRGYKLLEFLRRIKRKITFK